MPINDKNLGKYIRPAIYVEEVDKSIYEEPPIQEVLTNLVPGFSKKGPYNRPVKVNTANEFINIFGSIDRNLENKGSYFHKTALNMLERGPIWALNMLKTDPNRDKVNWKSLSLSTKYDNNTTKTASYEKMFDRQDFWELSMSEFLDIVTDDNGGVEVTDKLLHIANLQDKNITVYIYKSSVTGFDVTAEFWYGGRENVPRYINYNDWISDYMVSVLVIAGNWTNYTELSSDPYWSKYFTTKGINKNQIQNFVNDKNITTLAYYDASLIPNFKDINNKNMYIVDIINNDTDKTGLFCVLNEDALISTDSYMGRIDLLGQTLVGTDKKSIDFISYSDTIIETKQYDVKLLDSAGNVFGNWDSANSGSTDVYDDLVNRTSDWTDGYISGMKKGNVEDFITNDLGVNSTGLTSASFNGATWLEVGDIVYFTKSWGPINSANAYYIVEKSGANIKISSTKNGPPIVGLDTDFSNIQCYTRCMELTIVSDAFYNIGGVRYSLSAMTDKVFIRPFVMSNSGGTYSKYDIFYLTSDNTNVQVLSGSQVSGTTATPPNFTPSTTSTIILGSLLTHYSGETGGMSGSYEKVCFNTDGYEWDPNISFSSGTTSGYNYIDMTFTRSRGSSSILSDYILLRNRKNYQELTNKLITNKGVIINKDDGTKYPLINSTFIDYTTTTNAVIRFYVDTPEKYYDSSKVLIYYVDDEFFVEDGTVTEITSIQADYVSSSGTTLGYYSALYQDFYNGYINNYDYIYINNDSGTTQKIFLKFVIQDASPLETLKVTFLNQYTPTEIATSLVWANYDDMLIVYSDKSNWKQTVDVANIGITDLTNTRVIYVDKTRYSEIKRGDFLEAYYDTSYYDNPGEGYILGYEPKKFTRVYNITNSDSYKVLYTDAPIKLHEYDGYDDMYYTNIYPSIDTYFDQYRGIYLQGFNVSSESIPDGTDTRLSTILSVIDKDTKLAKGLSNKNRISWRYLVDSFGLGLTPNSKQEYVDLCGAKLNCLGFINMPSVKQLKKSIDPSFVDTDNTLNTEYLKKGGDDTMNPSFLYSFGTGVGESCVGYYFPYIKDSDDITRFYPPASYVARTYMNKFISNMVGIQPWTITAGAIYGIIPDIYETEINFSETNLDDLYQMGANPITYIMNRGYIINSENTAQVWPQSMLSLIHTRETLIELENRIYDMLLNYQWRFNNQESRSEIKYRADQICKELKEAGALYDYRNVIDSTNNTETIIEAQMGVLDTFVEIEKGMGIIVNQITILRKGVIESGGFATV